MKQLLIVKKNVALNAGLTTSTDTGHTSDKEVSDLSGLSVGAITFFELGSKYALGTTPTKNFGIALGRPAGNGDFASGSQQGAFVIPEIDINTLQVTKALPKLGTAYKRAFTIPTISAVTVNGRSVYPYIGVILVKGDTVPHERFRWHATVQSTGTPATDATNLKNAIDSLSLPITVTRSSAKLTIAANNVNDHWSIVLTDAISTTAFSTTAGDSVDASPTIGDAAYVKNLAAQCAGDKGYFYTHAEGREYIPGYPENVENLTPNTSGSNGASTEGYAIYTLRFQVGRNSAKTRDEKVWQLVHIAVPVSTSGIITAIDTIIPEGDFSANLATSIANAQITSRVGASYRDA